MSIIEAKGDILFFICFTLFSIILHINSLRPSDAYICVSNLTIIVSDNGLSPGRRQAIIWTNAGILLIGPLGTNFSEILIGIQTFSFKKMHLKMSSAKWRPLCLGLNVLTSIGTGVGSPQDWNDVSIPSQNYTRVNHNDEVHIMKSDQIMLIYYETNSLDI